MGEENRIEKPELLEVDKAGIEEKHAQIISRVRSRGILKMIIAIYAVVTIFTLALLEIQLQGMIGDISRIYGITDELQAESAREKAQAAEAEAEPEEPVLESEPPEQEYVGQAAQYLSMGERELVERVVAAEARGDSLDGMCAVAQCIRDRGDLWGESYSDVVLSPGQFAAPYEGEINDNVKLAVSIVFDKGFRVCDEPVTHFHADYVHPAWADTKQCLGSLGSTAGHLFYTS